MIALQRSVRRRSLCCPGRASITRPHPGDYCMRGLNSLWRLGTCLSLFFLLAGCTALQVGSNIQKGRAELMIGDPKIALAHFRKAAELDPDYILNFSQLPQGVWTYVGRAYYAQEQFAEARKAFGKARAQHSEDNLAKIYLGLVLARNGNRQRGLTEIQGGLTGLNNWLNHLEYYHPDGRFWDPAKRIRSEIEKDLAMISGKDIDWKALIASGEWIGKKMEEEIDFARQEKKDELYLNNGDDGGMD